MDKIDFEREVLQSEKPVVVDFWAPWCSPCRIMSTIFEELSQELNDIKFVKCNIDDNPKTATKYNIKAVPTFMVFQNGEIIGSIVGMTQKEDLKESLERI